MNSVIRVTDVTKTYGTPPVTALSRITFDVQRGEFVAIVGTSGSGKSTLLNILGTLDRPSSGTVEINGIDTGALNDNELSALRADGIGFVFQQFHLREGVSALGNVADGLLYSGISKAAREERARIALTKVGLGHRVSHRPNEMSGGERQRVAIARAVVGDPPVLLADEPTGNLDSRSSDTIVALLRELNADGTSVLMITHDPVLAERLPRRITISDGNLISDVQGGGSV